MTDARSRPRRVELTHVDGLDGLRGLAVAAVVLYHGGLSWATGGFLGVELFFVLSGFLITSLLVREWLSTGTIVLAQFWARRGRRLLPALFVLVVAIGIYYAIKGTYGAVPGLFGDGLSALFYYSNWHQIAIGSSYFAQTGPTSPFQHTWSLAIEEQFYLLWPLLVLGIGVLLHRRGRARTGRPAELPSDAEAARLLGILLIVTLVMLVASTIDTALLFNGGKGLDRVYFGTDSRAGGLLSGAALAIVMARLALYRSRGRAVAAAGPGAPGPAAAAGDLSPAAADPDPVRSRTRRRGWITPAVSIGSAVVLAMSLVLMVRANGTGDHWLYPWGFLLVDALSVTLIAVIITSPRTIANRIFTLEPLRWLGKISYGLYLWHFPLFLWIDEVGTGLSGVRLFAVRISVSLLVSVASYYIVEQPIHARRWPTWLVRPLAPVTAAAGIASLALATSAAAIPTGGAAAIPRTVTTQLTGTGPACQVKLANTRLTGAVPPPAAAESSFQTKALAHGTVTWPTASTTKSFRTCPPKRALLVGDSIAFTLGVPYLYNEQSYGMAISEAAILGCAFAIRGELDVNGTWEQPSKSCTTALDTWNAQAKAFGANEIIFQLGYRDEFNWKWNNTVMHLGQPAFDSYVEGRIRRYIQVLGDNGKRKLLFLDIPYVSPPAQANGSPAPQASTARHARINALIAKAAAASKGNASVLDIDSWLSPGGHYSTNLNGQLCRFDGVHVTVYCASVLEPHVLGAARKLLGS